MKHIAILKQPFFNMVLSGEKTIESRWSVNKIAPYQKIKVGDELFIKQTGKPVTVKAKVKNVKFYELNTSLAENIKTQYGKQIGIDKLKNWQEISKKKYCSLIWLGDVQEIEPIEVPRSNGNGWIILK